jgi:nucleotide-binding universal stress UspA family protein
MTNDYFPISPINPINPIYLHLPNSKSCRMDLSKLKGRPPFPFETIGVAIAFSPRLESLLGESWQLAKLFNARLVLMHSGERNRSKEAKLDEIFRRLGIEESRTRTIWNDGNPVDTLLELCKLNAVDLLVIGALRKENMIRYYLGSVARKISRSAKCSVLLLTNPVKEGSRFRKLMVNGISNPKTEHTIRTAVYFAKHTGGKEITVAVEVDEQGLAMTIAGESTAAEASQMRKEMKDEEIGKVQDVIRGMTPDSIQVNEKLLKGKPGYAIRQYAESKKADLLVINSPDVHLNLIDRIFTHDMEYILEDLPCNVLIVHSRING